MIRLYWCPRTRASRILWLLGELRQPYEVTTIDIRDPQSRQDPGFVAASPMGKVPAIEDGDVRMADSAAIAIYLADRYPQAGLAPAIDSALRGRYLYWMTFTPGVIEPAMAERFNGWEVRSAQSGWGDFERMIAVMCAALAHEPWLLGERFSAADVLVGSSVYFMRLFGILPEDPILAAYADRCLARPAYAAALERDAAAD